MIPNLISSILLIIGTPALFLILFLPALLELRRPRDRGPRRIVEDHRELLFGSLAMRALVNIEEEPTFEQTLLSRLGRVIAVLPCLEA